ncbi:MAG: acyltransferase [Nitrososphaerota archaeon]|nr:acyltransferase [Nitrososphaerota archaeon]
MKIALLQMTCEENKEKNVRKAIDYIIKAGKQSVDMLCLQELFSTVYIARTQDESYFELAETIPGPTIKQLMSAAKESNVALVAPIFEVDSDVPGTYYNTSAVIDRNGVFIGKYRKTHLPQLPEYEEKYYFKPGNLGYPVFQVDGHKIGVYICYDRHFLEGPRIMALRGAEVIFVPTCTGFYPELWELELRAHASFNTIFVAGVNRVGSEYEGQKHPFFGGSLVSDPAGRVLAKASSEEEMLVVDLDLDQVVERRRRAPFLRDRRPDLYTPLAEFT